jgi:hypothetical protein
MTSLDLALSAYDDLSGVDQMTFSNDGITWSNWEIFNHNKIINISAENGTKEIFFKVKDRVSNIANPTSSTIIYQIPNEPSEPQLNKIPLKKETEKVNFWILLLIVTTLIFVGISIFYTIRKKPNSISKKK